MDRDVLIVAAVRTPIGKLGGTIKDILPEVLAKHVIEGVIEKTNLDVDL